MPTPANVFGGGSGTANGYTARYVSSAAPGGGDGTTSGLVGATAAWTLAEAFAAAVAGQVVFIMDDGLYTLTADGSLGASGTGATGYIAYAGINNQNGSNFNDGRPKIDCAGFNGINHDVVRNLLFFENLEIINGATRGLRVAGSSVAYNVICHDNLANGFTCVADESVLLFCDAYSNGTHGFSMSPGLALFCRAYGNTQHGFITNSSNPYYIFCQSYENGTDGIGGSANVSKVLFCTIDDNTGDGVEFLATQAQLAFGNIISNNGGTGLRCPNTPKNVLAIFNHFYNNGAEHSSGILQTMKTSGSDPLYSGPPDFSLAPNSPAAGLEIFSQFAIINSYMEKGSVQSRQPTDRVVYAS